MKKFPNGKFKRGIGNKAFTLIELLAVIIILAVIALISTPIILNIINKSKRSSFTDTAYGIIESARLYYTEQVLDGKVPSNKEFKFDGSNNELNFNGTSPKGGSLILTSNGEISLAIHNGVWCASKAYNESKVTLKKYEESTCVISKDPVSIEEILKESSEVMSIDPDHNPRYVGANPSNYVKFNDELWRIIGIFDGQAKIIKNDFYNVPWDKNSTEEGGHGTNGYNDWSISTLKTEFNGTYLNNINPTYKNMIDETHVWNLGGLTGDFSRANVYNDERGTTVWPERPTTWTGAIGLMYASDYGYSTSATDIECDETMWNWNGTGNVENCKNNSWLYKPSNQHQWTLSPWSTIENGVCRVYNTGQVAGGTTDFYNEGYPVLYLKSEVKITDGNGRVESPFELSM